MSQTHTLKALLSSSELPTSIDIPCTSAEDGLSRWIRGVSQPHFPIAVIAQDVLVYAAGCYLKFLKLLVNHGQSEVFRILHLPELQGIKLIEGNPVHSLYAVVEICKNPSIFVYHYDQAKKHDELLAKLQGNAEFEYRCVKFLKADILLALVGNPEFHVVVWSVTTKETLAVVESPEVTKESSLLVTPCYNNQWLEWSSSHLKIYELQELAGFNVSETEIQLPQSVVDFTKPDVRRGGSQAINIVGVAWTWKGKIYVLDDDKNIYEAVLGNKSLVSRGSLPLPEDVEILGFYSFEDSVMVATSYQTLVTIEFDSTDNPSIKRLSHLRGNILKFFHYFDIEQKSWKNDSFYVIDESLLMIEVYTEARRRASIPVLDFEYCTIDQLCFIEPAAQYLATVSLDRKVTIWNCETGSRVTKWDLSFEVTGIGSHPILPFLACGTEQGTMVLLDITAISAPKVIYRAYLNDLGVIDRIEFVARGKYIICGEAATGKLYLQYGYPTLHFHHLDHILLPGPIWHINVPSEYKDLRIQVFTKPLMDEVPDTLVNIRLDKDQLEIVASQTIDAAIRTMCFSNLRRLCYAYSSDGRGIGFVPFTDDLQSSFVKEPVIQFHSESELDYSRIRARASRFYAFGEDGYVSQMEPPGPKQNQMVTLVKMKTHCWANDGVNDGFVSINGSFVLAKGADGTIVCVKMKDPPDESAVAEIGTDVPEVVNAQMRRLEYLQLQTNIAVSPDEITLVAELQAEKETFAHRRYQSQTDYVMNSLAVIREEMQQLLQANAKLEDDERLEMDEFELDSDEEEVMEAEFSKEKNLAEVQATSILEERQQWISKIRAMVLDEMQVTGSRIIGFEAPYEVSNYPLRPLSEEQIAAYHQARQERLFELKLQDVELKLVSDSSLTTSSTSVNKISQGLSASGTLSTPLRGTSVVEERPPPDGRFSVLSTTPRIGAFRSVVDFAAGDTSAAITGSEIQEEVKQEDEENEEEELETEIGEEEEDFVGNMDTVQPELLEVEEAEMSDESDFEEDEDEGDDDFLSGKGRTVLRVPRDISSESVHSTGTIVPAEDQSLDFKLGSRTYQFIEPNPLLLHQLDVSSCRHIRQEMILIENEILRLKEAFNNEFDRVRQLKQVEMRNIRQRNSRIQEIADFFNAEIETVDPEWELRENIQDSVNVSDTEIKATKYYTAEQLAEMERLRQEEEARRAAAEDDFYERALMVMMDGALDRKLEQVLKNDIPKPAFMLTKEEWEWNAEEYRMAQDYHNKQAKLEEQRVQLKKELEVELRTLFNGNNESRKAADIYIKQLWALKVDVEVCVRTEQVRLTRLMQQIIRRQQMDAEDAQKSADLSKLQDSVRAAQAHTSEMQAALEALLRKYDSFSDRERILDRAFLREFSDSGLHTDVLTRLYRKRPVLSFTNESHLKTLLEALKEDFKPMQFSEVSDKLQSDIVEALKEFDSPLQAPSSCPRQVWKRFVTLRRDKFANELNLKITAIEIQEMKKILTKCKTREAELLQKVESTLKSVVAQKQDRLTSTNNFEFQLSLPQGQIELEQYDNRAFLRNAILVDKSLIDGSNSWISSHGTDKIRTMQANAVIHRRVKQWEWRYKYAALTKQTLKDKIHDVVAIKATKQILAFIRDGRDYKKLQEDRLNKIKETQELTEKFQVRFMEAQKTILAAAAREENEIQSRTSRVGKLVVQQNCEVIKSNEIYNFVGQDEDDAEQEKQRFAIIMQTAKLMHRISQNAKEIVVLESELDRQYRRTYPVL